MKLRESLYRRHRLPPEIIQHAVWLYQRFNLARHLVAAVYYQGLRQSAFATWDQAVAA
jgi:hypothetical protein